jgi:hypothetical protein
MNKMKTLSKGRITPINDLHNLRYIVEPQNYIRQSRESILNAKSYVELNDDILLDELEIQMTQLLRYSNYPDYGALITGIVHKYYSHALSRLTLSQRLKWHYEHDVKGLCRRLLNTPQYALNYSSSVANLFKNGRFDVRTEKPRTDFFTSVAAFTNEENWLMFDALRLAQLITPDDRDRPSCISELIRSLVLQDFKKLRGFKVPEIQHTECKDYQAYYREEMLQNFVEDELKLDYKLFLKHYRKVLEKSTDVNHMQRYYLNYKIYLHMTHADRLQRDMLHIPIRLLEIVL